MSRPQSKADRIAVGKTKGKKRAVGLMGAKAKADVIEHWGHRLKDTSKMCSCAMCGNPRRKFKEKTIQEKKHLQSDIE